MADFIFYPVCFWCSYRTPKNGEMGYASDCVDGVVTWVLYVFGIQKCGARGTSFGMDWASYSGLVLLPVVAAKLGNQVGACGHMCLFAVENFQDQPPFEICDVKVFGEIFVACSIE